MRIHALTVCVSYSDYFVRSAQLWAGSLASLVVVTDQADDATVRLAQSVGAIVHRTDAFYRGGAKFNKGLAMQEARHLMAKQDWHLFLDADVVPPADWLEIVKAAGPQPGRLYGARRRHEHGAEIPDGEIAGYFQLFHADDPRAGLPLDGCWYHAGNYDSRFQERWSRQEQSFLPLTLTHLGSCGQNWCGRNGTDAMAALRAERIRRRGWRHETVPGTSPAPRR